MKLKNIVIVVRDIERAKSFYRELFGLHTILDNGGNVILTEGLVLQEEKIWREYLGRDIVPESNAFVLYFEERDIDAFAEKLESVYPEVRYVDKPEKYDGKQKRIRFYDPDGNMIEVRNPK